MRIEQVDLSEAISRAKEMRKLQRIVLDLQPAFPLIRQELSQLDELEKCVDRWLEWLETANLCRESLATVEYWHE
jgi:hypothetical protein